MKKTIVSEEFDFSDIREVIRLEDEKYFAIKAEGESKSDWKFNRDSNPMDYLSLKPNERVILVSNGERFGGYAKISFDRQNKSVFDVSVRVTFDYTYILPSMRGQGLSKPLNEGMCQAINEYVKSISDSFPMKRSLSLTVGSIPVSPGGLMMTYRLKEMVQENIPKQKYAYIDIKSVEFDIDTRQARFAAEQVRKRMVPSQELGYGN
ncbi:hypothetical protein RYA05_05075 [Pseudomonas syringae pv. actinidiae]|nr:hypothetical protein [Pseudomonas syringae pv. actinidiae]